MPERRRHSDLLVGALACVLLFGAPRAKADGASARTAKPLVHTAYTLRAREAQLGLAVQAYGLADRFTLATALLGWVAPAFSDVFAPNLGLRYRFADVGRWSFASEIDFAWVRVRNASLIGTTKQDSDSIIIPVMLRASHRARVGLLSTLEATYVAGQATLQDGAVIDDFNSAIVTSSLQLALAFEYPVARQFALTLTGRVVPWVPKGRIDAVAVVDDSNEVRVRGTITEENVAGSYNVIGGFAYYSRLFSFRLGAGYGRFILPRFGFIYLETGPVLDIAAYFRF